MTSHPQVSYLPVEVISVVGVDGLVEVVEVDGVDGVVRVAGV